MLYPLIFEPIFKERVWGGRKLEELYGKMLPPKIPIGESWEISDRPGDASVIRNGALAGKSLRWLMENHTTEVLGPRAVTGQLFPLLIKILDAREKLSLQVHPPAEKAAELGAEPKTELWHIAEADPGAEIYAGLRNGVTREQFAGSIESGKFEQCFHRIPVKTGDAMFLPSGRLHALGAGLVIFEIQQNSDTTYRVFDWNRLGLDGKPRTLHITESLQSIDFDDFEPGLVSTKFLQTLNGRMRSLAQHELFSVENYEIDSGASMQLPAKRMTIIADLSGDMEISSSSGAVRLSGGGFCLVPAALSDATIKATSDVSLLKIFLGNN